MGIRIGSNAIGWSNEGLTAVGSDTPLETCLAEARQADIDLPRELAPLESAKPRVYAAAMDGGVDEGRKGVAPTRAALAHAGLR